ncbi:RluA family pseudouridine synthase [Staphylospora marina]|uniref:RluA family pseudouridine synthase n=1 Tax=Staphylospora marina TaxID=2490858 RepID=UPI000F5BBB95|nr:RluA family pseudouridine synthase [Staphylospora marina]
MEQKETPVFSHRVTAEEDGLMLKQVLRNRFRFSRRLMNKLKMNRLVTVNGEVIWFTARVKKGDLVEIRMPEDRTEHLPPQPVEFRVVYEDADLIIIDKPPGLVVHPTRGYKEGTLANGLMHYWQQRGEHHTMRPVTRLDRDTSGLMAVAKHAQAHWFLAEQMIHKRYEREYQAICHGIPEPPEGTIDAPIGHDPEAGLYRVMTEKEGGYPSVTRYRVLNAWERAALLRLRLETGRTHQIRVHLSSIGHPLIGDPLYGRGEEEGWIGRQALHAARLRLLHPRHREWMEWESPLPADMRRLMERLSESDT